jgi:hypothetical protein
MSAARRRECDSAIVQGRARKAQQFWDAAQLVREFAEDDADISDVFVTLCVHAAIAAADVICCAALGEHAQGDNHSVAVNLLSSVDRAAGKNLGTLLRMKTPAGYDAKSMSADDVKRAERATGRLIDRAAAT